MPNMNKRRILIPRRTQNKVIFSAMVTNSDQTNEGEFSFRMNVDNGDSFQNLEYSLGITGWNAINKRDTAANLYTIMLPPNTINQPIRIRLSNNHRLDSIIIKYINLQLSSTVDVQPFSFEPSDISNLFVHYDSRDIEVTGTNVTQLNDLSTNSHNAVQATVADQPSLVASDSDFNGMPSVSFDGTDSVMATAAFSEEQAQPNTYIMVFKAANTFAGTFFDGIATQKKNTFFVDLQGSAPINPWTVQAEGGKEVKSAIASDTNVHIVALRLNTSSTTGYLDGTTLFNNVDPGDDEITGLTFGSEDDDTLHKAFKMPSFLMYNRLLTDPEINFIGNYLSDLYGTTWTDI